MFLLVTVISSVSVAQLTAQADDSAVLNDAAKNYGAEGTPEGFLNSLDKFNKEETIERDSFSHVLDRLITTGYINYTPDASAASGKEKPSDNLNCNVNGKGAGTLVYHNCDVPNISTEFLQDAVSLFLVDGPQGAEAEVATIDNKWFGLPGNIPGDSVPVNPSERSVKYTALELYGYNLNYTMYAGEWDHIKVLTAARSLSNFGFMDNLKLSVKTVINGITSGMAVAFDNAADSLLDGDIFGAIGGAFAGFFGGGASAAVNTVLDTSDLNVINSNAWYRVGFGSTLYNARELTQEEIAAQAKSQFMDMLTASRPEDAKIPDDLSAIKVLPEDPKEAIASCSYKNIYTGTSTYGDVSRAPGPAEVDCIAMAQAAYDTRQAVEEPPEDDSVVYEWIVDGSQKLETLESWKATHSNHFTVAGNYNMNCSLDTNEGNRKDSLAALRACWGGEWNKAAEKALQDNQKSNNSDWMNAKVNPQALAEWFGGNSSRNFNAPWERFVCVDSNGNDIIDGARQARVYNENGELNSACKAVRPPIQNGFFGSGYITDKNEPGYVEGRAVPAIDTRNALVDTSIFNVILPIDSTLNSVSNFGLSIAVLATRISNTVLNLSFAPILDTLGLDDKIAEIIKSLRDSLFFPLAILIIAASGVTILFKAGKNKDYGQQGVSILIMCLTFVCGVFMMYRPEAVIKVVDEVPAMVEQAIVGTIFSVGSNADDELCTATGTASAPKGSDLEGNNLKYSPQDGTRSLMCENWRVFGFTPYIYGQWGAGFEDLYAANTSKPNKFNNTNENLVGNASVNMGSGKQVNNWGLYQLDVLSSGTSTDRNYSKPAGFVDNSFYKIVDMQAGPNNGAGTDGKYIESWSGNNGFERAVVGLISSLVGILGMFTVITFAMAKIEITFVTTFMLLFLPMMFLIGLHPTMGRGKLKAYIGTIIGLMVQRVILVTLLAVMFKVVIGIGTASTGYILIAFTTSAVCVLFLFYKKEIMGMITQSMGATFGPSFGGEATANPRGAIMNHLPKSVQNYAQQGRRAAIGVTAGAVGGYLSGNGAIKGARESAQFELASLKNQQRRKGFGLGQSAFLAADIGKKDALQKARNNSDIRTIREELAFDTDQGVGTRVARNLDSSIDDLNEEANVEIQNEDKKPYEIDSLRTAEKAGTAREISKLAQLEQRINALKLEDKQRVDKVRSETVQGVLDKDDINTILKDQDRLRKTRRGDESRYDEDDSPLEYSSDEETQHDEEIDALEQIAADMRADIIAKENSSFSRSSRNREMKKELKRLIEKADEALQRSQKG